MRNLVYFVVILDMCIEFFFFVLFGEEKVFGNPFSESSLKFKLESKKKIRANFIFFHTTLKKLEEWNKYSDRNIILERFKVEIENVEIIVCVMGKSFKMIIRNYRVEGAKIFFVKTLQKNFRNQGRPVCDGSLGAEQMKNRNIFPSYRTAHLLLRSG